MLYLTNENRTAGLSETRRKKKKKNMRAKIHKVCPCGQTALNL